MSLRKISTTSFIALILLVACLFEGKSNQTIEVFSSAKLPDTLILISRITPGAAADSVGAVYFTPGQSAFATVLFRGGAPEQILTGAFDLKRSLRSVLVQSLLDVMIRIDRVFTVHVVPGIILYALPRSGTNILWGESAGGSGKEKMFSENFLFFRYFPGKGAVLDKLGNVSFDELANFLLHRKAPAKEQGPETVFKFQRLNLSDYPSLRRPVGIGGSDGDIETMGFSGFDSQNLVLRYLTLAGPQWAYCASFRSDDYRCSHRMEDFRADEQLGLIKLKESVSKETDFPLVRASAGGAYETAISLMNLCSKSALSFEQHNKLHDLVLKGRIFYSLFSSTTPMSLAECAQKIGDQRLLSYSRFVAARLRFEQADYLSSGDFFGAITGEPDGWGSENFGWNWHSDAALLVSASREKKRRAYAERIAGLNIATSPSERATDALILILLIDARHLDRAASIFARNSLLNNGRYLTLAEKTWVEGKLRDLSLESKM